MSQIASNFQDDIILSVHSKWLGLYNYCFNERLMLLSPASFSLSDGWDSKDNFIPPSQAATYEHEVLTSVAPVDTFK